ncbi:MAG TPA: DUF2723 domain-containing protein [Blastocatellia bacterium]
MTAPTHSPPASPYTKSLLVIAAAVLAVAFGLYISTLAPAVGPVDSGELTLAAYSFGVAHPPGFPLYTLLAHLATLLPFGSIAVRVNLASAFFAALASAMMALIVLEALRASPHSWPSRAKIKKLKEGGKKKGRQRPELKENATQCGPPAFALYSASMLAGLLLAFSRTLWSYATVAEVYALNTLLLLIIFFLMLRWRRLALKNRTESPNETAHDRWLFAAAFIYGMAMGVHHVTVALMLPALAALVYSTESRAFFASRRLLKAALFALAGLAIYIYLPVAAARGPVMNWGDPDSAERFWWHVTGWQYQSFFTFSLEKMIRQAGELFIYLGREFGPLWLPIAPTLAIAGFISLFKRERPLFWFLVLVILFDLIYALNYEIAEDKDAYYLPVFAAIIISAGYGLGSLLAGTSPFTLRVPKQRALALLLVAATLGCALASNYPYNNRRNYYVASDYVNNILSTIEPGGMLITLDWQVYSPLQFLHEAEDLRPDLIAIDINQMRRSWYFDYLDKAYPQTMEEAREQKEAFLEDLRQWEKSPELYDLNLSLNQRISERFKGLILKLVENHLRTSSVYASQEIVTSQESRDSDWMRELASRYGFVPQGLVFQVFPDKQFHEPAEPRLEMRGLVDGSIKFEKNDVVRQKVLPVYVTMHYNRGRYLAVAGKHDRAVEAFKQALEIEPENSIVQSALNESLARLRSQHPDRP